MPRALSLAVVVALVLAGQVRGEVTRRTLSLDGTWELGEGALGDTPPEVFDRRVPVPGLVDSAEPPYAAVGVASAERQAFWYRRTFTAPAAGATALLRIHRSQFGIKVWLNGELLGTHLGAFTLAELDARGAISFGAENTVLIRVGAGRAGVQPTGPIGT